MTLHGYHLMENGITTVLSLSILCYSITMWFRFYPECYEFISGVVVNIINRLQSVYTDRLKNNSKIQPFQNLDESEIETGYSDTYLKNHILFLRK